MKAMGIARNRSWKFAAGLAFLCSSYGSIATARAQAQVAEEHALDGAAAGHGDGIVHVGEHGGGIPRPGSGRA